MTSFWCFYCQLRLYFTPSVSIVDFEQVNICWRASGHKDHLHGRYFEVFIKDADLVFANRNNKNFSKLRRKAAK